MSGLGSALLATFIIDAIVSLVALWWAPATAYQQRPRSHRLRPHTERAREDFSVGRGHPGRSLGVARVGTPLMAGDTYDR